MNDFKKKVLEEFHSNIIQDVLDPEDILIHLESKNIIQATQKAAIMRSPNATAELIKVLLQLTGGPWFEEFVDALSQEYNWISNPMNRSFLETRDEKLAYYLNGRGNVPPLPQHNVSRGKYVQHLRQKIKELKRDQYLVVHGMSGCGKTSLVVDALQDMDLVESCLQGCVYWLSVGDYKDEDSDDDLQYQQLQKKLWDMVNPAVNTKKDLISDLKMHFTTRPNFHALLILDDVNSFKVIEALNVGCKILVTTQDCDVMKKYSRKQLFPINEGFSESESVKLLQDFVLDGQGELLPHIRQSALKIHQIWKGHPMVIGLIGGDLAEFKEESQKNQNRWKDYERNLSNDSNVRRRSFVDEQISSVIEFTLDKLSRDSRELYSMLAVFVEDTNVTTDVLKILWELPEHEVQKTMDLFYRRSLVLKKYNSKLNTIIYGVHNILLGHLKQKLSCSEVEILHKTLVSKYLKACRADFSNLPSDNYIYSYLCHHIDCANQWDDFRDQFFSLRYIESKLKSTGPGDLLLDLHKYEAGLVGNSEDYLAGVKCIRQFVENYGWDIHQNVVDIIQCAFQEDHGSFLHQQAAEIALERGDNKIYLMPVNISKEKPKEQEAVAHNVKAVSIVRRSSEENVSNRSDERCVLVYPAEGDHIVELDMNYRQNRRSFQAKSEVVILSIAPQSDKFLSASANGCIDVWSLASDNTSHANTPPPSMRQRDYLSHFSEARSTPVQSFRHTRRVTCAQFSNSGKHVVSTSEDGTVRLWNLEENRMERYFPVNPNPYPVSCCFTNDDAIIVYCCQNFKLFFFNIKSSKSYSVNVSQDFGDVIKVICVQGESKTIVVVFEKAVLLYRWEDEILTYSTNGHRQIELKNFKGIELHTENNKEKITCAVYCPVKCPKDTGTAHRLLIGTSQGCCLFLNVLGNTTLVDRFASGEIKAVDMVDDRVVFAQHDKIKMCWIDSDNKYSSHVPVCAHLGWNNDVSVYATVSSNGAIKVYNDGKSLIEVTREEVFENVHVSTYGNHVLLGRHDGTIEILSPYPGSIFPKKRIPSLSNLKIVYLNDVVPRNSEPIYIIVGQNSALTYSMKVITGLSGRDLMHCSCFKAPVVKTFLCSNDEYLMVILRDLTIMICNLRMKSEAYIHKGKGLAKITDASLSCDEDVLVLSDEKNSYHIFSITWPNSNEKINQLTANFHHRTRISETRPSLNLDLFNHGSPEQHSMPMPERDEVDGTIFHPEHSIPSVLPDHYDLDDSPSWCCCICSRGELIAIGHGESEVLVRNFKRKQVLLNFKALPSRHAKVSLVRFSPYDVILGNKTYGLILLVVSDCFSLWDMSPFTLDNAVQNFNNMQTQPACLSCVRACREPILELSVNLSFKKFAAFDENHTYYLWKVWE